MATITNKFGETVTVFLGGIGNDNAVGTVTDARGIPVSGARVSVTNKNNNEHEVDQTNATGDYDIDINGAKGDRVFVHVEWQDGNGRWHVVSGFATLAAKPAAGAEAPELAELAALEVEAMERAFAQKTAGLPADLAYHETDAALIKVLNGLKDLGEDAQKDIIDKLMYEEMILLLSKIRKNRGTPRNDNDVWSAIEEILRMLLKLYVKALILQGRGLEPLPGPGPAPEPGPDIF